MTGAAAKPSTIAARKSGQTLRPKWTILRR